MSEKGNLLGATTITRSYSITLIKSVRKQLGIKVGDVIGFYTTKENALVIVPSQLKIDLAKNEIVGSENIPTNLQFRFLYTYVPEEVASLIPVTIQVNRGGTVIAEYTLASNNQGKVNIQLPAEFEAGTYTLTIMVTDSAFVPMTETRTLIIEQAEVLQTNQDTSILATIVTTIGFLGVLAVSYYKRYTKS